MISLPQIQFACDQCEERVEVEIEMTYIGSPSDFYFDAGEWLDEHGWSRVNRVEIQCPKHTGREEVQP